MSGVTRRKCGGAQIGGTVFCRNCGTPFAAFAGLADGGGEVIDFGHGVSISIEGMP